MIEKVEVADADNAVSAPPGGAISGTQVGNVFWRSPEAQMGIRIQKPTDIWSFGMLVSGSPTSSGPTRRAGGG